MAKHLQRDLERLQQALTAMGVDVEQALDKAIRALRQRDRLLADEVVAGDQRIDEQENCVEEQCLTMLALHQPVAVDLRRVTMGLKVNTDLERMADLAVEIARCAARLTDLPAVPVPERLAQLAELATSMVWHSLDALFTCDKRKAARVHALDDQADRLCEELIREVVEVMRSSPDLIEPGLCLISTTRRLERIADHATNIAEDVIYLVEGKMVRHHPEAVLAAAQ